ncbi:MAG: hypothetical protein V7609_2136 [Verrucomicrobiota bacterium]
MKKTVVRVDSVSIPIYPNGDGRFAIVFREAGQRIKRPYVKLSTAKRKAQEVAVRLLNGQRQADEFTAADRDVLLHIKRAVEPFRVSPVAAIEQWATWRCSAATAKRERVPALVELLIATKTPHKLSTRRMREFNWLRDHFAKKFPGSIETLLQMELEQYYAALGVGDRRRNNIRDVVVTLFLFAKEHGYLPADKITEAEKVKRIELDHEAPEIYTPAQLVIILEHVAPEWLDPMCCQAFLGVRPEEASKPHVSRKTRAIRKLMWTDFLWDEKQLRIVGAISKTGRDRYVDLNDTFLAWCGHHRDKTGPVAVHDRQDRETGRLTSDLLGFDWINDGLRHSYASYWNSVHKDMAKLKEMMGNSEQVNRRYYYHPQPVALAKKWWQVLPAAHVGGNIIQAPLGLRFA